MNRTDVLKQVAVELAHVPHWPGEYQGMLRAIYQLLRANNLGARPGSASHVLHRCITTVWRDFPNARVDYDRTFFDD